MKFNAYKLLNSKIFLLILGFVLTGVVGSFLNYKFQKEAWRRQVYNDITRRQLEQAREAVEETLLHINKRFYAMQKIFWSLEAFKTEEARQRWEEYDIIKDDWNIKLGNYKSKIAIFVDPDLSYELLDENEARNYQDKESLHAVFVIAHYKLKNLLNYNGSDLEYRRNIELAVLDALKELGNRISDFSERCYKTYANKQSCFKQDVRGRREE